MMFIYLLWKLVIEPEFGPFKSSLRLLLFSSICWYCTNFAMIGWGPLVLSLRVPSLCTQWKATLFTVSRGIFKADCMNSLIAPSGLLEAASGIAEILDFHTCYDFVCLAATP